MSNKSIITKSEEIEKTLDNINLAEIKLNLTQKDNGKILNNFVRVENVNLHSRDFAIRPSSFTKYLSFNNKRPIDVKTESNSLEFTTYFQHSRLWKQLGIIRFPKVINLNVTRQEERYNVEKYRFPIIFKNFTLIDYTKKHNNIESELMDLSKSGLALKIRHDEPYDFSENDKIIFTLINGQAFTNQSMGRLIHINRIKGQKNESPYYKVGIKFEEMGSPYTQISHVINQTLNL